MSRRLTVIAVVLAFASAGAHAGDLPSLYVDYREDCTFRLTNDVGAAVTQVAPSIYYQVVVATPSPFAGIYHPGANDLVGCNGNVKFRVTGPGVGVTTTLDGGDGQYEVFSVMFAPGAAYTFQDDTNVTGTRRTVVASAPPPAAPKSGTTPTKAAAKPAPTSAHHPAVLGTLAGSVTTTGKLALTLKGRPVTTLKRGRYALKVLDETSRAAFVLQRVGEQATKVTTDAYLGRRSLTLVLEPGRWTFFSVPGAKHSFLVTA
jgi:hypothetical protein